MITTDVVATSEEPNTHSAVYCAWGFWLLFFFFKQKTAYEIGLGIPAEPLFRSLASISRWITASSSWKRFCLFVCRALSSIMVICMLTAIRLLLTFVMSLYLLLRS